ncbi:WD40 repeat domain-containing protein [Nostoc punctiforme]|uniref:WD-40 repeat protein n=1 Tax=Nostoc punctiforme (strain ATCC 29133 / PCC 73102) TaxID=63737 RepID=B2IXC4_NOSP7|nr:WD40 repeat domain-containing protein [Nostoc punctiforme]ACC79946.1 WD-40 repeat protein [Nostoc punctiforme PCC 73102]
MSKQGEIQQSVTESEYAATSATGNATITVTNYYYREEARLVASDSTDAADESLPCPYRGLFHFGPNDADIFFGREIFIEELYSATKTRNFIPVLGASGSGKSSVVLAGLVPKLQTAGNWQFTHFRPGADPFHALAVALVPLYTPNLDATDQIAQARKLAGYLQDGSMLISDVFAKIRQNHPNQRVLLIADQFEEIYTLCHHQETRHKFLDCLLASLETSSSLSASATVWVTTMRADFLGNALSYRPFADILQNADVKLGPMNREELTQVIEKPAEKLGVTFASGLVERILEDVENQPGNLPLLEFALTELWNKRTGKQLTHKIYEEIGQVEGALARHADEKYGNLTEEEKEKVRRIFIQLVRPGEGTEDTRRVAMKAELGEQSWDLVKQLADARLVVTSRNATSQETVEVVHEALIRNWGELREWMNKDRVFRAWQERLRSAKGQWEATQRDEGALLRGAALVEGEEKLKQRREDISAGEQEFIQASVALRDREQKQRERTKRLTFSGLAGGLVLALGLSGLAGIGWGNAEISQINAFAQSSDGFLSLDGRKAVESSVKAAVKMRGKFWVDANTRTQVKLTLLNTVHNVAAPNTLGGHAKEVQGISFSPDGKMLASASDDNTVKLWDTTTGKEIKTLTGHTNSVLGISFSPDGKMLASASSDNTVKLWDTTTGKEIKTLTGHTNSVLGISFSPDGKMLASASADNTVKLWDTTTGKEIKTLTGHRNSVFGISFSPDGKMLASASADNTVKLWDTTTGKEIKTLTGHRNSVFGISFSPDGKMLASASFDNTVKLWDTTTGKEIKTLTGHRNSVNDISFSPDGKMLASASDDNTVKLWDTTTGKEIKTLTGHRNSVNDISFSPNGKMLASASFDNTVKLWDTTTGKEIKTLTGHTNSVNDISFSPDGKMLASASGDNTVKLWDTTTGKEIKTLTGHRNSVNDISFSPDGKMLASASGDNTVKLWDTTTGKEIKTLTGHTNSVNGISFSPDGKMLASASGDKTVKLWDTTTGKEIKTLTGHTNSVNGISFSPDGKMLASASGDKTVKLWDTTTGKEIKTLTGHTNSVNGISFSPDGKMLASASSDNTVKLWDTTTTGKKIKTLTGHTNSVNGISFSPDGKMLASASSDNTVKLWDTTTGKEIKTLTGHTNWVYGISFSPDGKMLASASTDNTVKLWRLDFDYLLQKGCSFMREYYKTNPPDNESDKHLCDGVGNL